jgi:MFS transporter, putative metabolite:H+ symporter
MQAPNQTRNAASRLWLPVAVGAMGYFVDIYDLVLFSIVRVASLRELGVADADLLPVGVMLLNCQMAGMLVGGILWGILGDKKGRLSVLFGSIFLYSAANIANGFIQTVPLYAVLRFVAGVGLAGELGAAVTLVSETLPRHLRGYGTSLIAGVGVCGAVFAGLTGDAFHWRNAYILGGILGLVLLVLRVSMFESGMYLSMLEKAARKGDFRMLFTDRKRFTTYLSCILIGVPIWYVVGILITFSPEITRELGVLGPIQAGKAIMWCYGGLAVGDIASGFLSQKLGSRKKVLLAFLLLTFACILLMLFSYGLSPASFYYLCALTGFATGYWAIFVTIAAEHFGTNLRATVATSVPNFVRGAVVPITLGFEWMHRSLSLRMSALIIGTLCMAVALIAWSKLRETHGSDLNYVEI